jgi:hypothetical protein
MSSRDCLTGLHISTSAHQHVVFVMPALLPHISILSSVCKLRLSYWRFSALATPAGMTRDVVMLRKERVHGTSVLQKQTQSAVRRSKLLQTPAI